MTRWGTRVWIYGAPWRENGTWMYSFDYNLGRSEGYAPEGTLAAATSGH